MGRVSQDSKGWEPGFGVGTKTLRKWVGGEVGTRGARQEDWGGTWECVSLSCDGHPWVPDWTPCIYCYYMDPPYHAVSSIEQTWRDSKEVCMQWTWIKKQNRRWGLKGWSAWHRATSTFSLSHSPAMGICTSLLVQWGWPLAGGTDREENTLFTLWKS
jgi:hypothetical protein